jgi:hypothetical protein
MSLRDELLAIHAQHGKVTPTLVVATAADAPDSDLHRHLFVDFDDDRAAEVGRLHRAHKLIQKFKVIDNRSPGEESTGDVRERIRLFSAIPSTDDPGTYEHHPTEEIIADPIARAVLLRDAERAWKALKARYGHLKEFEAIVRGDLGEETAA